jgi:hypothetical protein
MRDSKQRSGVKWEELIRLYQGSAESARWVGPLVEVADTMDACRCWFETQGLAFTNADLIAMARAVMERFDRERREARNG